jgi:von Willebrand factor type A domain/Aerotolerance regulator N-terminal
MRWLARSWFSIAVFGLLLLALPGLYLFGMHVAGMETTANDWLEQNLRLSFHVALPLAAAGVLLSLPFLLVLLYFLKLKRKALQVPSTFLWKKSIEDLHVNSLFQWLRKNVLLLLQLLAVLCLIYSILAPKFFARGGQGRRYVILVDNSASMGATDVAPNRLALAKDAAIAEIDGAGDSDAGMVIAFNSAAEIRQSFTTNKHVLKQAVSDIQPTFRPTRIEEALSLADSLANPTRSTEDVAVRPDNSPRSYVQQAESETTAVHLFSDGRFPDAPDFATGNLRVQFHAIGQPGSKVDNIGIVSFSATRDDFDPSRMFVNVRVFNFRDTMSPVKVAMTVYVENKLHKEYEKAADVPARVYDAPKATADSPPPSSPSEVGANLTSEVAAKELPGRDLPGEGNFTFEVPDIDDRQEVVLRARLVGNKDVFPADDEASLVVGVVRKASVLLIGPPNPVLNAFFDDVATRVVCDVTKLTKDQLTDKSKYLEPAQQGLYDLVIFDRCAPEREDQLPQANTVFVGRPPPPWQAVGKKQPEGKTVERVDQPAIKGWTNQHGLLRYLTGLHEVGLYEAYRIGGLPPRTPKLMEGDRDLLLMFTLSRGPYTDAVMTFPIVNDIGEWNTNWPLLPSFPLFWRNVLYTLGNIRDASAEENVQPGQVKTLKPGPGINKLQVTPPNNGPAVQLDRGTRADFAFGGTDQLGVYSASWANGSRRFTVNLLDADESNLQPRAGIRIGAETVTAGTPDKRPRELWKWLILAALVVVLVEWYVYNQRVFV